MSLLSVDFEGGKRKNVELMIPPPGALDDFWEVSEVSGVQPPIEVAWGRNYVSEYENFHTAGVTLHGSEQTLILLLDNGIRQASQPLVSYGMSKEEAFRVTWRFVMGHEMCHVRQIQRGDAAPLSEDEADDWAWVVFNRLGWDPRIAEFLHWRWPHPEAA